MYWARQEMAKLGSARLLLAWKLQVATTGSRSRRPPKKSEIRKIRNYQQNWNHAERNSARCPQKQQQIKHILQHFSRYSCQKNRIDNWK